MINEEYYEEYNNKDKLSDSVVLIITCPLSTRLQDDIRHCS